MIATGGIGGLFEESTNPRGSFGQGVALAARAGAALADMEFVQFHPTALDCRPAANAARQRSGARRRRDADRRDRPAVHGSIRRAPNSRRATWSRARSGAGARQGHRVFLDARKAIGAEFATRFPIIAAACRADGVDPAREPIPVKPAAALSHGRRRGGRRGTQLGRGSLGLRRSRLNRTARRQPAGEQLADRGRRVRARSSPGRSSGAPTARDPRRFAAFAAPLAPDPAAVRPILSRAGGVMREGDALRAAVGPLAALARSAGPAADPAAGGAGDRRLRAAPRGEPRRALSPRLPASGQLAPRRSRITLDEALAEAAAIAPDNLAKRA